jgi:DNA-binding SARP family transcriptional activator
MWENTTLATLEIHTFGGLRLILNGLPLSGFISRKVEALLIYLACNPRDHPREVLAEMLWDDLTQERTMANLRQTLSDLQKQLAPFLLVSRQAISINPDSAISLDLTQLDRALTALEKQLAQKGELNRKLVAEVDDALRLYNGDFLQGFNIKSARGFEGWRLLEAEQIRGRVTDVFLKLAHYALKQHTYSEGITYAARLLKLDPISEEAHRLLMMLYAMSGQKSSALTQYETCRKILQEELELEPEDETTELYAQIRDNALAPPPAVEAAPHNLTMPSTAFVPRPELQSLIDTALRQPESRLVSLVGAAGSGKTRLALSTALEEINHFPDGVFFVPFTAVHEPERIAQVICNTLAIDQQGGIPPQRLLEKHLSGREMLLVLDNLEHLLDGVGVLSDLLAKAPGVKLLVTSIERLNLIEEWVIQVSGMTVPPADEWGDLQQYNAVQLFIQSARRVNPSFASETQLADIVRICQFLHGNPLGIELAASWVRMMSCAEILVEMHKSLDFLTTSLRNLPERHRSMRGIFEALWRLLSPQERLVMAELSIFRGGFTNEAAREVVGVSPVDLMRLVDKSILSQVNGRYDMHPLLLKFLHEKLRHETTEWGPISRSHSRYYAKYLHANRVFLGRSSREQLTAFTCEVDNMVVGLRFALLMRDEETIGLYIEPLYYLFSTLNRYYEGRDIFAEIVTTLDAAPGKPLTSIQARALVQFGVFNHILTRYDEALPMLLDGLVHLRKEHNLEGMRMALKTLAVLYYAQGDYQQSRQYYEELLTVAHEANNPVWMGNALFGLGNIAVVEGDYPSARRLLSEARTALNIDSNIHDRIHLLMTLGDIDCKLGYFDEAGVAFEEALYLSTESSSKIMQGVALVSMARVAYGQGRYEESKDFCRRSIERCEETRNSWGKAFALTHLSRAYYRLNDYTGARHFLRKSMALAEQIGNRWVKAFALREAGRRGLMAEPQDGYLVEGLRLSLEIGAVPLMLNTMSGIAEVMMGRGETQNAVRLATFIQQHPVSEYEALQEAQQLIETIRETDTTLLSQTVEAVAKTLLKNAEVVGT